MGLRVDRFRTREDGHNETGHALRVPRSFVSAKRLVPGVLNQSRRDIQLIQRDRVELLKCRYSHLNRVELIAHRPARTLGPDSARPGEEPEEGDRRCAGQSRSPPRNIRRLSCSARSMSPGAVNAYCSTAYTSPT